ncbi:hypothetical protein ACEWY4_026024 [Coilia grayii]|uniref:AIG1-type G domain-containing protein n=1 Tax=Coilia grayii TaxID=363190 RepID=A0ABD1IUM5_9TELE
MLAPGPHAFLIVVGVGRFTKEEQDTVQKIQEMFGADVGKYAIVVFTRKDELLANDQTIDDFVKNAGPELKSLLRQCGGRYHAINNRRRDDRQVTDLLKKVEALAQKNNSCYTSVIFELATKIKEKDKIIKKERKKSNNWAVLNSWIMKQNEEIKALEAEIRRLREKQKGSCTIS